MVSKVICSSHICYVSDLIHQRDTFPSILFLFSCNFFFLIRKTTAQIGRGGVRYLLEGVKVPKV